MGVCSADAMLHRSSDSLCTPVVASLTSVARATFRWSLCVPTPYSTVSGGNQFYCLIAHTVGVEGKPSVRRNPGKRPNLSTYREYPLMGMSGRLPFSAEADAAAARKLGSNLPHSGTAMEQLLVPSHTWVLMFILCAPYCMV